MDGKVAVVGDSLEWKFWEWNKTKGYYHHSRALLEMASCSNEELHRAIDILFLLFLSVRTKTVYLD